MAGLFGWGEGRSELLQATFRGRMADWAGCVRYNEGGWGVGEISQKYLGQRGGVVAAIANIIQSLHLGEGGKAITKPIYPSTSDTFPDIYM